MGRKSLVLCLLFIFSTVLPVLVLAAGEGVKDEALQTRAAIAAERTRIVLDTLKLSDSEIEVFSPVYLDYWKELNPLNERLTDLILDYSSNFQNLTDPEALGMLDEYLDILQKRVSLRKKYVRKFKKVLPTKKLVQYYQIDNKLDAIIMAEMAASIPLVR